MASYRAWADQHDVPFDATVDRAHLGPGEEDRTRAVMDAVLGGLRTGCGS
ncbi:hypothetical protein [Streptomyces sp. NPDC004065]